MTAAELFSQVQIAYDQDGLIALTNIRDRTATQIDILTGQNAAQAVIDLWPAYAQEPYDRLNPLHVQVAIRGTIAVLWSRGGTSATIAKVEWDEVFSADGMIAKVRRVGPRGRQAPSSNSGMTASRDAEFGRRVRPWSDPDSLPMGILPNRRIADHWE